jgi:hypothetical protein
VATGDTASTADWIVVNAADAQDWSSADVPPPADTYTVNGANAWADVITTNGAASDAPATGMTIDRRIPLLVMTPGAQRDLMERIHLVRRPNR